MALPVRIEVYECFENQKLTTNFNEFSNNTIYMLNYLNNCDFKGTLQYFYFLDRFFNYVVIHKHFVQSSTRLTEVVNSKLKKILNSNNTDEQFKKNACYYLWKLENTYEERKVEVVKEREILKITEQPIKKYKIVTEKISKNCNKTYSELIIMAIKENGSRKGLSRQKIFKFVEEKKGTAVKHVFRKAIYKAIEEGKLVQEKQHFKITSQYRKIL